jgi:two-component system, chemotaxis family, sensor kinase CheA
MNQELHQQLIKDLLIESFEGLDRFDSALLALEKGEHGADTLNSIFRIIHTIKGTSGCLGFGQIESVAHAGENLLSQLREGALTVNAPMISALLRLSDALRQMLRGVESTGAEGGNNHSGLINQLERLQRPEAAPVVAEPAAFGLFDEPAAPVATVPPPDQSARPASEVSEAPSRASVTDTAIRVDVSHLDRVMNLVGELVLARNQIVQHVGEARSASLLAAAQRLSLITTELQEGVMKTRMQPIGNVWSKFPRVVRDVALELGKQVRLEMFGNETELDRTIIEAIKDPLTHIVRNAIDHGIETPEARTAVGKSAEGHLLMRAFHEGGQVIIEVIDDGAGIDLDRVKAKALERGVLSPDQAARLSERDAINLIFHPGLSTAARITNVSGRGVGMDVVKTNVEKIGGSIDVSTVRGQGTTLKLKIPLTLAIIPALIVTSGGDRFAISQVSLVELVRLEGESARKAIEHVFSAPVYRLRGKLLPIVSLNEALELGERAEAASRDVVNIVVLQADGEQFGLVVDAVNDTQEIVVKPLGKHFKGINVFAGATIMGDGRVALILDVLGLAARANVVAGAREHRAADTESHAQRNGAQAQRVLLFSLGGNNRMCMPLSSVGRLEKVAARDIEFEGSREVVQYRGSIMPLVRLDSVVGSGGGTAGEDLPVVVFSKHGRSVGLVVGEILDVVEQSFVLEKREARRGVAGSAVIQGRVTEMLDVTALIREIDPTLAENAV